MFLCFDTDLHLGCDWLVPLWLTTTLKGFTYSLILGKEKKNEGLLKLYASEGRVRFLLVMKESSRNSLLSHHEGHILHHDEKDNFLSLVSLRVESLTDTPGDNSVLDPQESMMFTVT